MIDLSLDDSYRHCQRLAKRTAGNFYYSFLTLPRDRFRAMCALYAFMRVTDDLGDSDQPMEARTAGLAEWRGELTRVLDGAVADHPVLPAMVDVVRRHGIPRHNLFDVITGVEMDLGPVAIQTYDELRRYCHHVAGAVGLACIHVWGFHDDRAIAAAEECGLAFQLTNILRDLREDVLRGRIYLPREDLDRFGYSADDLARGVADDRFRNLMQFEVARAREHYAAARSLFDYLDAPGQPILDAMLQIYGGLLDEIERSGYDVFSRRVSLSRYRKWSITLGVWWRNRWRRGRSQTVGGTLK